MNKKEYREILNVVSGIVVGFVIGFVSCYMLIKEMGWLVST